MFLRLLAVVAVVGLVGCVKLPPPSTDTMLQHVHHGPDGAVYIIGNTQIEFWAHAPGGPRPYRETVYWLARCLETSPSAIGGKLNCKEMEVLGLPSENIEKALMEVYEEYKKTGGVRPLKGAQKPTKSNNDAGDDR